MDVSPRSKPQRLFCLSVHWMTSFNIWIYIYPRHNRPNVRIQSFWMSTCKVVYTHYQQYFKAIYTRKLACIFLWKFIFTFLFSILLNTDDLAKILKAFFCLVLFQTNLVGWLLTMLYKIQCEISLHSSRENIDEFYRIVFNIWQTLQKSCFIALQLYIH